MKKIILLFTVLLSTLLTYVSAQTTLDVPVVGVASKITLSGFTANWTAVANATSYSINVYDGTSTLVTGSPKTITGASSSSLAITGMLQPNTTYTYTVTAIGDGVTYLTSAASASSASFTTATSTGTYTLQYAASDAATLLADLKGGAADIYELTTSGGAYTFVTTTANNAVLIRNTTVRATTGLAAKPVLKLNSTATGTTTNIFYSATAGLTLKFDGLEFDGVNPGTGGTQPMAIYDSGTGSTNIKLYVSNCYFHDFKNASGNGVIRLNGSSGTQTLDIQGSVFNACGGRILYLNGTTTSPNTTVNLKNNTFSNTVTLSTRNNIIYNNVANSGTTTIDHCTFYKVGDAAVTSGVLRITGTNGAITFKNSIFVTVPTTLPTATVDYCYVAGLTTAPTGATNTFVTTPTFTNTATLDFSLSNKSSFVCADASIAGNTTYYSALPKLTSPTVGTASSIGTNGFTANWSAVANASGGYTIKVYKGLTLVSSTTFAGQATTSSSVTGLQTGTTYTYTVTALGDAINYDSSVESSASASFSTLGLVAPTVGVAGDITSTSFTANWTPVANASSYNVMLYVSTNLVNTTNVLGQSSSSLSLTGLTMGTTYTYKVVAVGDGVTYFNSDPSTASSIAKTLAVTISQLNPDFSDGTWGTVSSSSLALGSYPTFSANGFDLTKAYIQTLTTTGLKGESFTHVLRLDKQSNSGVLDFPTIASVSQLEIHASATTGRQFTLFIWNSGTSTYDTYATYATTVDTEQIFTINFASPLTNAKFRIINISTGAFTFYKIKTHTTQPVSLTTPTVGAASSIAAITCTANWTPVDANATNYEVKVYKGTTLKVTATTTGGQATSSLAITGLQADSTYTYKVKAIGDGDVNYSDSYQSVASASFTMGHQLATPVVGTGTVSATGITANWTNAVVTNVLSYDIKVYQGSTLVKTVNVADPNATSVNINGLIYATEYTFTVTAIGDNSTYFNSAESAKSAPVTTDIGTGINNPESKLVVYINGKDIICSETGDVVVYNVQGVKVLEAAQVSNLTANLSSGLYMVNITTKTGKVQNTKLIIR